jgi:hypothetical protein
VACDLRRDLLIPADLSPGDLQRLVAFGAISRASRRPPVTCGLPSARSLDPRDLRWFVAFGLNLVSSVGETASSFKTRGGCANSHDIS